MTYDPDLIDRLVKEAREAAGDPQRIVATVSLTAMADQLEAARREVERLRPVEPWVAELQREVDGWRRKAEVAIKLFGETHDDAELMRTVISAADAWRDFSGDDDTAESNDLEAAIDAYRAAKGKT